MSKHQAMINYISAHIAEIAGAVFNFNFSNGAEDGNIAFLTQYSDNIVKQYTRNHAKKEYGFAILISKYYSKDSDDINLLAMDMAQAFNDWIDAQEVAKNYPVFDGCQILRIESLQNMPNLSSIDETETIAQYMLQCKVTYYE